MIIAIDGPAASGKSSVAKIIARKLGFRHIETGAMYRAVAWKAQQLGLNLNEEAGVARMAEALDIELIPGPDGQTLRIDGRDVTPLLKSEGVGRGAATVAGLPRVREILVAKQQQIGARGNVVMDGRDIGTVVFPHADLKFFLDADAEERGRRRFQELKDKHPEIDLNSVIGQVRERDRDDRNRKVSPLVPAGDAIQIDTTRLDIDQVVNQIMRFIEPSLNKKEKKGL